MLRHIGFDFGRSRGFSLVEVLCALTIAALAMVGLLRSMGTSQLAAGRIESHLGARIILQSIIEDELSAVGTSPAHREGESGRYRWSIDIRPAPADVETLQLSLPNGARLYRISAEVNWTPNGRIAADVVKLGGT